MSYRVVWAESPKMDKLDEVLYTAHKKSEKAMEEWREKAEEALEEAKRNNSDWLTCMAVCKIHKTVL